MTNDKPDWVNGPFRAEDFAGIVWVDSSGLNHHISEADATDVTNKANAKFKELKNLIRDELLCYSTGASVLSEDRIKEIFG